jgi:hypothetical protein
MCRLVSDHIAALKDTKPVAGKWQRLATLETRYKNRLQLIGNICTVILQKAVTVNH